MSVTQCTPACPQKWWILLSQPFMEGSLYKNCYINLWFQIWTSFNSFWWLSNQTTFWYSLPLLTYLSQLIQLSQPFEDRIFIRYRIVHILLKLKLETRNQNWILFYSLYLRNQWMTLSILCNDLSLSYWLMLIFIYSGHANIHSSFEF